MPVLFLADGTTPLTDKAGNHLKTNQTVTDDTFGDGIVRGTVPLDHGQGLNVVIDWLGPKDSTKPKSRGAEFLIAKFASGGAGGGIATVRAHTGAEFESGALHAAQGRNDADAERLLPDGERIEPAGAQSPAGRRPTGAGADGSTRTSPRLHEQRQGAATGGSDYPPWLGKADRFDGTQKLIISHYEHRIILDRKLDGGAVVHVPKIALRTKYEPVDKERQISEGGLNPSRLGDYLIESSYTPDRVKEEVARKMRTKTSKRIVQEIDATRTAGDSMAEVLQTSRKAAKAGTAEGKDNDRSDTITKYIVADAALPDELYSVVLHCLAVFIFMCRLPFSIVVNCHFLRFLWSLRPTFAKRITPRTLRDKIATDLLDEVYEETKEITAEALSGVPGRPTLGMDGHKEGTHRHVETITKAKLGISTFAGAEYMRTTRTSGQNLSVVALKYLTPSFIALVADNTGNNTGENTGLFAFVLKVFPTLFCLGCYVHVFGERAPPPLPSPPLPLPSERGRRRCASPGVRLLPCSPHQ
jgi:hypothetical protein